MIPQVTPTISWPPVLKCISIFLFQNTPYLFYLFLESFNVLYVHTRKSYWILWRKRSGFLSTRLLINNSSSQWKSGIWIILLTNCLEKYDSNQQLRAHVSPRVIDRAEATLLRLRISPRNCKRARSFQHSTNISNPELNAIMKEGDQSILTKV